MGVVADYIAARNMAQDRASKAVDVAHARARQPVVEGQQDQIVAQKLAAGEQDLTKGAADIAGAADDRQRTLDAGLVQRRGQFAGAIARQIDANPNAKPSDIAKNAPPEVLKAVGLDDPEQLAHFAEVYDNNPQQLRAAADMYGQGRKVKQHSFVNKDGQDGMMVEFDDGTQQFNAGVTENKQFRPAAEVDPEMTSLKKELIRTQISNTGARTAATEAKSGGGSAADAAAEDLLQSMEDYKSGLNELEANGGAVRTGGNIVSNALNVAAATGAGKVAGSVLGDKNTATRQKLDQIGPTILHTYAAALGLKSAQLNTEKEYQRFKAVMSDPNAPTPVRLQAFNDLERHIKSAVAARNGVKTDAKAADTDIEALLNKYK